MVDSEQLIPAQQRKPSGTALNLPESVPVTGNRFTFWGVPASPVHDSERGFRLFGNQICHDFSEPPCPSGAPRKPFLTNPTDCLHGPFSLTTEVQSWLGHADTESIFTHDDEGNPIGQNGRRRRVRPEVVSSCPR
jgi:hypothetical protein